MLLKIADVIEANADRLAKVETVDNGKAVRESMAADLPLVIDHFRYFAGVIRAEEGTASEIDVNTISYCIQEPLGVIGQIIPWNFPLLMATWKIAPALAAGNKQLRTLKHRCALNLPGATVHSRSSACGSLPFRVPARQLRRAEAS